MTRLPLGRTSFLGAVLLLCLGATTGVALAAFEDATRVDVSASAARSFPPIVRLVPHIAGAPFGGNTLRVVPSVVDNAGADPTRTYTWYRCTAPVSATTCQAVSGATGTTLTVPSDTEGTIRSPSGVAYVVQEQVLTDADDPQDVTVASLPTSTQRRGGAVGTYLLGAEADLAVYRSDPTTMPSVSGFPRAGQASTVDPGTWATTPSSVLGALASILSLGSSGTFTYQWQQCPETGAAPTNGPGAARCTDVAGATDASYAPTSGDVGRRLRVRVTRTSATPVLSGSLSSLLSISLLEPVVATVTTQATPVVAR
ncbi:hypothetical protein ACVU7I_10400 [Patulibacter sp. S7RM1-6]